MIKNVHSIFCDEVIVTHRIGIGSIFSTNKKDHTYMIVEKINSKCENECVSLIHLETGIAVGEVTAIDAKWISRVEFVLLLNKVGINNNDVQFYKFSL